MKDIELWQGDCLELMNNIPDKSVDMIFSDLPYATTRNSWDCMIDLDSLWEQYKRVVKKKWMRCIVGASSVLTCIGIK